MPPRKRREEPEQDAPTPAPTQPAPDVRRGTRPGLRLRRGDRRQRFLPPAQAATNDPAEG